MTDKTQAEALREELIAFLNGEAPLDGVWFGERHPGGPFWWRGRLTALASPAPSAAPAEPAILERIRGELEIMLASAQAFGGEYITGYGIKTGAMHRLLGIMQSVGYPIDVPLPAAAPHLEAAQPVSATSEAPTAQAITDASVEYADDPLEAPAFRDGARWAIERMRALAAQAPQEAATLDQAIDAYTTVTGGPDIFSAEALLDAILRHPQHADGLRRYAAIQLTSQPATREEIEAQEAAQGQASELPDVFGELDHKFRLAELARSFIAEDDASVCNIGVLMTRGRKLADAVLAPLPDSYRAALSAHPAQPSEEQERWECLMSDRQRDEHAAFEAHWSQPGYRVDLTDSSGFYVDKTTNAMFSSWLAARATRSGEGAV